MLRCEICIGISACTKYDWYNKSYFWDKREEFKWKNQVEQSGVAYRIREVGAGLPLENSEVQTIRSMVYKMLEM